MSEDAVSLAMGDPGSIKQITGQGLQQILVDPQSLNSYSYARNNPIRMKDPSGHWFWDLVTGKQSLNDFEVEVGDAANQLYDSSPVWHAAMDHPIVAGIVVGVVGGVAAAGGAAGTTALSTRYLGGAGTACLALCGQAKDEYTQAVQWAAGRTNYNPSAVPSRDEVNQFADDWVNTNMSKSQSAVYHMQEHADGRSFETLTRDGNSVWNQYASNSNLVSKVTQTPLGDGTMGIKVQLSNGYGGIYNQGGKIVTTWINKK